MHITNAEAVALRRLLGHHMSIGALTHMGLLDLSVRLANEPGCGDLGVLGKYDLSACGKFQTIKDEGLPVTLHHERLERRKVARVTPADI